jgi:hypothetical protein
MRQIEEESRILYYLEAIDIEGEEYVFWDANGAGVSVAVTPTTTFRTGKLKSVTASPPTFPLGDALKLYGQSIGLPETMTEGQPIEVWNRIQEELGNRPKRRGFLSKLLSR